MHHNATHHIQTWPYAGRYSMESREHSEYAWHYSSPV
jgi:hypothetical protein